MRSIEIVVNPQGAVKIETKGFAGGSCREASKALEDALGIKAGEKLTAEFYQQQVVEQPQRAHG